MTKNGVEIFGLMGVIVGPILMALCLAVIRISAQEHPLKQASLI